MTMVHAVSKRSVQFVLYFLCFILNWSGTEVAAQDALRMRLSGSGELGKDATLTCVMNHKGNVTWAFAGAPIKIENRYSVTTNLTEIEGTLENSFVVTIRNTTKRDVGVYSCMFEKEKVDTTLHLYFNGSLLKITDGPVERDLQNHPIEKVILFCIFEVYNTTAASWYKKESNDKKSGTDVVIDERSFKSSYFVSITNSDIDDGTYVCEVYDPVAEHYITGEVDVHIRDRPWITLFEVIPISDTELYLNWTVNIHHCPIQKYEVTYKVSNELVIRYNNQEIPINSTRFVLNNLNKTTTYDVTLYVNTTCGTTPMLKSNTTLNKKPVFVPDISIKGFSATSVTIGWVSPPANIAHLIHYYLLEARKNNDNDNITKLAYHSKDSKNLPYMFDNLEPYSTYTFRVQACSYYLESCWEWSKTTDAATLDGIPGHPENLDVECGDKYVTAKWAEPLKPNAEIRGYQLEITGVANYKDHLGNNKTDTWGPRSKFEKSDSKSARFDGLFPNMKYTVRVSAFSRTRKRGVEAVRACATPPAPPDALPRPHWQKIMLENGTFLFKAYLQKVTERNGPICCYRVYMMRLPADMNWIGLPELDKIRVVTYEQAHTGPPILAAYITDVFTNDKFPEGSHIILGDNQPTKRMPDEDNCIRCSKVPQRDVPTTTSTTSTSTTTTTTTTTTSITLAPVEDTKSRRRRNASEPDDEVQPQDGMLDPAYNYTFFIELIPGEPWLEPVYTSSNSVLMAAPSDPPSRPLTALEIALQATCACAALALVVALVVCAVHARRDAKPPHAHELNRIHNVLRRFNLGGRPMVPTTPPDLPPIAKEDLAAAYAERQADSDYGFQKEFELLQMLPDCFVDRTTHASEARENQSKNRYPDIKAYDQTRVRLSQIDSITGSDYINANYVMGYQERKQFICAQGPTETTVNDFWRMIWEHGLELIVMLTNLEEYSKVKCSKYWPDEVRGSRAFGNVTVHHVSEKRYSDYIVRELKISKQSSTACIDGEPIYANNGVVANGECKLAEDKDEGRTVHQYHFLMWKDFAAPEYPHSILKFIKRVNEAWSGVMARPAVVHCSAGVGRTGTLVALDYLLDQLRDTGHVSIFNTIAELRRQRNFLVQSLKQYVFVYRALVEYAHYGDTEIPASRLKTSIDRLRNTPEDEDKCLMEHEFEKICNSPVEPAARSCAAGAAEELRPRNRRADCLPYDANRVILTPLPGRDYSTYINASFIEAYDNSEGFIITQDPLPNTIMDFWRMVSEHNVSTIVMLSELGEGKCPRYWEDGTATHEHISVQYEESDSCPYYTRRQFRVTNNKNGDVSVVRQLQYQGWPTAPGHVPEVTRGLAELADAALPAAGAGTHVQATRPLAVHCQGTERSALFVALCVLITQLRVERRVDVCAAARKVRDQRARTIDSVTQYEFLHRAILNYAELHNLQEDS